MAIYRDLNQDLNEFRLLTIEPGPSDCALVCSLETLPLGDYSRHEGEVYDWTSGQYIGKDVSPDNSSGSVAWVPAFEALSYTWGDQKITESISLNGEGIQITTNLKAALLALRKIDQERVMWVDALCINQENIQERNEQVPRMPDIYQRATRTISWLGEANDSAIHAMELLEQWGGTKEHVETFEMPKTIMHRGGPQFEPCYFIDRELEDALLKSKLAHIRKQALVSVEDFTAQDWESLEAFFKRPYWRRLWIIQEIVNSRDVDFQCGQRTLNIQTLMYFPYYGKNNDKDSEEDIFSYTKIHNKFREIMLAPLTVIGQRMKARHWARPLGFESNSTSLLNIIEKFRGFNCTDPRDRVYALLGLPSMDRNMPLPKPDYRKSVAEIYSETIKAIIQHTGDLAVICAPRTSRGNPFMRSKNELRIPVWAPDWNTQADLFWDPEESAASDAPVFSAAGDTLPDSPEFSFPVTETGPKKKRRFLPSEPRWESLVIGQMTNVQKPRPVESRVSQTHHGVLDLNGFAVDRITELSDLIPDAAFASDNWKEYLLKWEELARQFKLYAEINGEIFPVDPGLRHPILRGFLTTITKGKILVNGTVEPETMIDIYVEHYLVWTARISPAESRHPIQDHIMAFFFENLLKDSVRGWKFALTQNQTLALVPAVALKDDLITILFGADFPVVMRPACRLKHESEERLAWTLLGGAWVPDIMRGQALEKAIKDKREKQRFLLL